MRRNYQNLEDLVLENKQELLADKEQIEQIERRLEKVQADLVRKKRKEIS
ncbi:MAG TPA: FbpB family small basic protein [Virgibacillus sp.]|nr:FbpB family small basic protein [Virgibacillus sp.]